jgi:Flp pilus assembly protein protease CpaA
MVFGFLFWVFLVGIIIAGLQDLKRREVDNWLNLLLLISGLVFILYKAFFEKDISLVFRAGVALGVMFIVMNMFYYGRVFAGGDAKLLLAMTAFFVAGSFEGTLINIGTFLLFLMLSGSVYGLCYSSILYIKDRKKINKEIKKSFKEFSLVKYGIGFSLLMILFGIILRIFTFEIGSLIALIGIFALLFPLLFVFSKALEKVSMVRVLTGKELREGDWLVDDVKVKGKVIKANWEGLTKNNLELLIKKKKVKIKEGLPFVPAFFIAFLLYSFGRDWFIGLLFRLA